MLKLNTLTSEICFVPDSQIIFPAVFLTKTTKISYPSCMYRDCFDLLKRQHNYVILPSNKTDFSNLILEKFGGFLKAIEYQIGRARTNKTSEAEFYAKTYSQLQSMNTFDKHLGDLMLFWDTHKEVFWSFVSLDFALSRKNITTLTLEKMGVFAKICEGHEEKFSEEEQKLSECLYVLIKEVRTKKIIKSSANDGDLLILADCFIYKSKRFLQGYMYLITNDNELHGTATEIVAHPNIIFPEMKDTEKFVGFEPIRPNKFISSFKATSTK